MEKETLSLFKIKKDLMNMVTADIKALALISVICLPFIALMLIIYINFVHGDNIIGDIIIITLVSLLSGVILLYAVFIIIQTILIKMGKFTLETDELIGKEEETPRFVGAMHYKPYRLYFKRNETFEIPFIKSYRWSRLYAMRAKELFITSDVGDNFLLVILNREIELVYNYKYFEPSSALL